MTNAKLRITTQQSYDRALAGEAFTKIQYQPDAEIENEFVWNSLYGQTSEITGLTALIQDSTARKLAATTIEKSESKFHLSRIVRMGIWDWNIPDNKFLWSEEMFKSFEIDPLSFIPLNEKVNKKNPG